MANKDLGFVVPTKRQGRLGYGNIALVLDAVECALATHEYLVGDTFSAADVYLGWQLAWGMTLDVVERRAAFERYRERLQGRPAFARARNTDDALLPERQAKPQS